MLEDASRMTLSELNRTALRICGDDVKLAEANGITLLFAPFLGGQ
jgi:hypothetical protein